uniref:Uncharacterized protein n=1 Tax=Denticeps clupeoides TaxID=299321 RepID=A0AAY4EAF0_9TELE
MWLPPPPFKYNTCQPAIKLLPTFYMDCTEEGLWLRPAEWPSDAPRTSVDTTVKPLLL